MPAGTPFQRVASPQVKAAAWAGAKSHELQHVLAPASVIGSVSEKQKKALDGWLAKQKPKDAEKFAELVNRQYMQVHGWCKGRRESRQSPRMETRT